LRPRADFLLPPLATYLEDEKRTVSEVRTAASIYGNLFEGRPSAFAWLERHLADHLLPATQRANLGTALAAMGRVEKVWPLLKHSPDPTLRSYLIERLGPGGVDLKVLAARLDQEPDASIRRALVLSLGQFDEGQLLSQREPLAARLLEMYRDDPDGGMHSAAEWVLRSWSQEKRLTEIDKKLSTGRVEGKRQWYINRQGQTMVFVPPPGEVSVGRGEYRPRIDCRFAIAAKDVTVAQFLHFCKDRHKDRDYDKGEAPTVDCPMPGVSWYEAAEYCNWLSEQDGIKDEKQWCYLPNDQKKFAEGMKLAPDYRQRKGYRLPREEEWEHTCAAGSVTEWSCGSTLDLLERYGWTMTNSFGRIGQRDVYPLGSKPVGTLKPNDLGLFDMHGNVWQWCQEKFWRVKSEQYLPIRDTDCLVLRGGSFKTDPRESRSDYRQCGGPDGRPFTVIGFRPARTFP
jgi:formylglycine-generating enzyme required for sulfatase activity